MKKYMEKFPKDLKKRIIGFRGFMGLCHLLIEEDNKSAILLDTGLFGEAWMIKLALKRLKLKPSDIKAIVLTHGHLDHSGNASELKSYTGAPIYAHPLEQEIINGEFNYNGINKWCGRLETIGRKMLGVGKPSKIDVELSDNMDLPFFGGLRTLHLPGHTMGHCGFYSEKYNLLFSGDLFASYTLFSHLPPPILNTAPDLITKSFQRVQHLNPKFIIPQHYDFFSPEIHKKRFEKIYRQIAH